MLTRWICMPPAQKQISLPVEENRASRQEESILSIEKEKRVSGLRNHQDITQASFQWQLQYQQIYGGLRERRWAFCHRANSLVSRASEVRVWQDFSHIIAPHFEPRHFSQPNTNHKQSVLLYILYNKALFSNRFFGKIRCSVTVIIPGFQKHSSQETVRWSFSLPGAVHWHQLSGFDSVSCHIEAI